LFGVYVVVGPAGRAIPSYTSPITAPPPPAPAKPDPAAEARLTDYDKAYATYNAEGRPGVRCEQLGPAFNSLTPSDVSAGRSVLFSTAARIRSLGDGQTCHDSLAASDARFDTLERAVSKSDREPSADPCPIVPPSYNGLTDFDRSRSRFKPDSATIAEAQSISAKCRASDDRLKAVSAAVAQLRAADRPETYTRAAEANRDLTDFDRDRASSEQKIALAEAQKAANRLSDSKARIARLPDLISAARDDDQDAAMTLFSATTGISSFDLSMASPEEKSIVEQARKKVTVLAWEFLRTRLAALEKDRTSGNYQAVVDVYRIVLLDQGSLTDEQRRLKDEGRKAAQFIAASDARLQNVLSAATAWNDYGLSRKLEVQGALDSLTKFDMGRFGPDDVHQQALDVLKHADTIIRGPELGLKNSGAAATPIYVFPSTNDENDALVAGSLRYALKKAGYLVSQARQSAALLLEVNVVSPGSPQLVTDGSPMAHHTQEAEVRITARWVENDMVLTDDTLQGTGQGAQNDVKILALRDAVSKAVDEIKRLTTR
jgi:hypothetical protein